MKICDLFVETTGTNKDGAMIYSLKPVFYLHSIGDKS